jgi:hypothetical protein
MHCFHRRVGFLLRQQRFRPPQRSGSNTLARRRRIRGATPICLATAVEIGRPLSGGLFRISMKALEDVGLRHAAASSGRRGAMEQTQKQKMLAGQLSLAATPLIRVPARNADMGIVSSVIRCSVQ